MKNCDCECCKFSYHIKTHYEKHLKTNNHKMLAESHHLVTPKSPFGHPKVTIFSTTIIHIFRKISMQVL